MIDARGVVKGYLEGGRRRVVLDGVDFTVADGEQVAVMGPSGSGKSTLLNLLGAMEPPDAGTVRVADEDLTSLNERGRTLFRRRRIGFVFQELNLVPTLTVLENLLLPLELNGALDTAGRRRAGALLERVGLGDRGGGFPENLSGGERQRVAVVRALVHRPALLLADEPTGSLDAAAASDVLSLFAALRGEHGLTAVLATHSSAVAARADRIVEVGGGRLREGAAA